MLSKSFRKMEDLRQFISERNLTLRHLSVYGEDGQVGQARKVQFNRLHLRLFKTAEQWQKYVDDKEF